MALQFDQAPNPTNGLFTFCAHNVAQLNRLLGSGVGNRSRRLLGTLAVGCAVLVASPSWAAMIEPGTGDLTINRGEGFQPVTNQTHANIGDLVMVGPSGAATITYDDGCKVAVQTGSVATIAPLSPCASGSYAQTDNDCPIDADGQRHCDSWFGWGVLGAALAAIITIPIVGSQNHGETFHPASGH